MSHSLIQPNNVWWLWAIMVSGVAVCIYLEQNFKWAAKTSGPVLALLGGMLLSNSKFMPVEAPAYDVVDDYLVPIAVPLLLFRANLLRIVQKSGSMFLAFHIAAIGTVLGAFVAGSIFRGAFPHVPEVTGVMTGSYIGGGVNFVAVKNSYQLEANLTNPLLVADNFIMAGMFALLFVIAGSRLFRRQYPHPHSVEGDKQDAAALAAKYWERKPISLLDLALALAIAVGIAAISINLTGLIKAQTQNKLALALFANPFVLITIFICGFTTIFHRWTDRIHGADELGGYFLYIFFFVIGLRADLWQVITNVPVLFLFCLVMAGTNLVFTLVVGRLLKLNLEELLLSVNATLGGAPSAGAMAISRGWSKLVLPGILAGIWGYVIGTFIGILVTEILRRW